jgi:hypothetical protein
MAGLKSLCATLVISMFVVANAQAMSCVRLDMDKYELVFKGEAVSSAVQQEDLQRMRGELHDEGWNDEIIDIWFGKPTVTRFKVSEVYKGESLKEVDIYHFSKSAMGLDFSVGNKYLIHSSKDKDWRNSYAVSRCGVEPIDEGAPSEEYLRARNYKAGSD